MERLWGKNKALHFMLVAVATLGITYTVNVYLRSKLNGCYFNITYSSLLVFSNR